MSKISLEPNASGAGTFTLAAPNSNTNRTLNLPDASGNIIAADASTGRFDSSNMPAGSVIQVVSTTKTDTFSATVSGNFVEITGLSATITPTSDSSKILIFVSVTFSETNGNNSLRFRINRDATSIGLPDSAGSRILANFMGFQPSGRKSSTASYTLLDLPSTTASIDYSLLVTNDNTNSETLFINRAQDDADNNNRTRTSSTITVMEVAG